MNCPIPPLLTFLQGYVATIPIDTLGSTVALLEDVGTSFSLAVELNWLSGKTAFLLAMASAR